MCFFPPFPLFIFMLFSCLLSWYSNVFLGLVCAFPCYSEIFIAMSANECIVIVICLLSCHSNVFLSCYPDVFIFLFSSGARDYAVPDVTKSALNAAMLPIYPPQASLRGQTLNQLDMAPPAYDPLYAAADVVSSQGLNIPNLQVSP